MKRTFSESKVCEVLLWFSSYAPLLFLAGFESLYAKRNVITLDLRFLNKTINLAIHKGMGFVLVIAVSFLFFVLVKKCFFKKMTRKIRASGSNKKIRVKEYDNLSLDEYSFFIISLILPFVFESFIDIYNLYILIVLIIIIIAILTKMGKIALNPIFLFGRAKVFQAKINKIGSDKEITCYIITELDYKTLENEIYFSYEEYFRNVFFIVKQEEKER